MTKEKVWTALEYVKRVLFQQPGQEPVPWGTADQQAATKLQLRTSAGLHSGYDVEVNSLSGFWHLCKTIRTYLQRFDCSSSTPPKAIWIGLANTVYIYGL
jgi:hypothetical protein